MSIHMHVSLPYKKIGRTKTEKILHPDNGFKELWKAHIEPRAKYALHALRMFSSMDLAGERSDCHQTPKHLAAGWVKMVCPKTAMDSGEGIRVENFTISVLEALSFTPFVFVNS